MLALTTSTSTSTPASRPRALLARVPRASEGASMAAHGMLTNRIRMSPLRPCREVRGSGVGRRFRYVRTGSFPAPHGQFGSVSGPGDRSEGDADRDPDGVGLGTDLVAVTGHGAVLDGALAHGGSPFLVDGRP